MAHYNIPGREALLLLRPSWAPISAPLPFTPLLRYARGSRASYPTGGLPNNHTRSSPNARAVPGRTKMISAVHDTFTAPPQVSKGTWCPVPKTSS